MVTHCYTQPSRRSSGVLCRESSGKRQANNAVLGEPELKGGRGCQGAAGNDRHGVHRFCSSMSTESVFLRSFGRTRTDSGLRRTPALLAVGHSHAQAGSSQSSTVAPTAVTNGKNMLPQLATARIDQQPTQKRIIVLGCRDALELFVLAAQVIEKP